MKIVDRILNKEVEFRLLSDKGECTVTVMCVKPWELKNVINSNFKYFVNQGFNVVNVYVN